MPPPHLEHGVVHLAHVHGDEHRRVHLEELRQRGIDDVLLFCGGIIPEEDTAKLEALGFQAIFRPGTNTQDIVKFVYEHAKPK